jgi:serine/threonine-protein kinase
MGEVCRARDTKLNRTVALKVLPELFASDPERLARFRREAQMLAALNHVNIAQIYGLEEVSAPSGSGQAATCALVMELVEGTTLANRIARGPVPVAEALALARQVGDALQTAHDKGIIHRDLKPANIIVTDDGRVKVLDFGLAKMLEPEDGTGPGGNPGSTNSPTLTTPAMMTGVGMILGTAAYMAPEQARGKQVDKRADIWAFGVVLYEMLAGKRLFDGEEVGDTLAGVLKSEPNWTALPPDVPPAIRALLKRCLEKDRTKRIGDIAAAVFALDETALAGAHQTGEASASTASMRAMWNRVAIVGAAALMLGAAVAGSAVWFSRPKTTPRVTRTQLTSSGPTALSINGTLPDLTITPDGSRVVYVGAGGTQLFVRALDSLTPVLIATGSFRAPFVSPDGQWVGIEAGGVLIERVPITGGPLLPIVRLDGNSRGAAWMPDHTIIFADGDKGLQRVADAGGMPEFVTHAPGSGVGHLWPEILPGGQAVLFTIDSFSGGTDPPQLAIFDLRTGMQRVLLRGGSHAHYVESGHLVYAASGALFAVPFDLSRLETRGAPVPVVQTVGGVANFAVGADGTLVYADAPGGERAGRWYGLIGREKKSRYPRHHEPTHSCDCLRTARASPCSARTRTVTSGSGTCGSRHSRD